jgi:hypothetical protein
MEWGTSQRRIVRDIILSTYTVFVLLITNLNSGVHIGSNKAASHQLVLVELNVLDSAQTLTRTQTYLRILICPRTLGIKQLLLLRQHHLGWWMSHVCKWYLLVSPFISWGGSEGMRSGIASAVCSGGECLDNQTLTETSILICSRDFRHKVAIAAT